MIQKLTDGLLSIRPVWARRELFYLNREFQELIARCRVQGYDMHGLEVFTPMGELLDVVFPEDGIARDLVWAKTAILKFQEPDVLFCGSLYRLEERDDPGNETMADLADALDAFLAGRAKS